MASGSFEARGPASGSSAETNWAAGCSHDRSNNRKLSSRTAAGERVAPTRRVSRFVGGFDSGIYVAPTNFIRLRWQAVVARARARPRTLVNHTEAGQGHQSWRSIREARSERSPLAETTDLHLGSLGYSRDFSPRMREIARRRQALLRGFQNSQFSGRDNYLIGKSLRSVERHTACDQSSDRCSTVITVVTGSIRLKNSPRLAVIVSRSLGFLFLGRPFCLGGGTTAAAPLK